MEDDRSWRWDRILGTVILLILGILIALSFWIIFSPPGKVEGRGITTPRPTVSRSSTPIPFEMTRTYVHVVPVVSTRTPVIPL